MKVNSLLVSLVAGSCATVALAAGQDDVTKTLTAYKVDKVRMVGNVNGGGGGFGSRLALVNCYNTADLGAYGYLFWGGLGLSYCGDTMAFEKSGYTAAYTFVAPVAAPAKVSEVEFWLVASDPTTNGFTAVDATVTVELWDVLADWLPAASTCAPSGDANLFQVYMGGFYVDLTGGLAPWTGYANGYVVDVSGLYAGGYFNWNVTDGNACVAVGCWAFNGGSPPVALSSNTACAFMGTTGPCVRPQQDYQLLGWSQNFFYWDADASGTFDLSPNERYWYGGPNGVSPNAFSSLMLRLAGDEGCSYDLNGDTFVNADDTDYGALMAGGGCPY